MKEESIIVSLGLYKQSNHKTSFSLLFSLQIAFHQERQYFGRSTQVLAIVGTTSDKKWDKHIVLPLLFIRMHALFQASRRFGMLRCDVEAFAWS